MEREHYIVCAELDWKAETINCHVVISFSLFKGVLFVEYPDGYFHTIRVDTDNLIEAAENWVKTNYEQADAKFRTMNALYSQYDVQKGYPWWYPEWMPN